MIDQIQAIINESVEKFAECRRLGLIGMNTHEGADLDIGAAINELRAQKNAIINGEAAIMKIINEAKDQIDAQKHLLGERVKSKFFENMTALLDEGLITKPEILGHLGVAVPAYKNNGQQAAGETKSPRPIKFLNVETGDSWSGRGPIPKWLNAALKMGHTKEQYLVKADATKALPTVTAAVKDAADVKSRIVGDEVLAASVPAGNPDPQGNNAQEPGADSTKPNPDHVTPVVQDPAVEINSASDSIGDSGSFAIDQNDLNGPGNDNSDLIESMISEMSDTTEVL
jgi:DNA-binding protein H-NS